MVNLYQWHYKVGEKPYLFAGDMTKGVGKKWHMGDFLRFYGKAPFLGGI